MKNSCHVEQVVIVSTTLVGDLAMPLPKFSKLEMQNLGMAISRLEKALIEKALRKFAGNQSKAAQALSISETNLRYKMKKLGLAKRDFLFGRNSA